MNKPPAFPLAPAEYDAAYLDTLTRILAQYLNQAASDVSITQRQSNVDEILIWLS